MEYKVKLKLFEGPMDLLLHLIDEADIDIYDIPINEVTKQYLSYITRIKELDLEIASEFLLMASTLLEIKSKMLLPQKNEKENELLDLSETDPRLELVKRLIEYKKYKEISKEFEAFESMEKKTYYKPKEDLSFFIEEDEELEEMELSELVEAFNKLLIKNKESKKSININEIQREEYTLEESIKKIKKKLTYKDSIKFDKLFDNDASKKEIIVNFLSLLELIRIEAITIYQKNNFSEILIIRKNRKGA